MMRIDHIALYARELEDMRKFFVAHFHATSSEPYHNPKTGLRSYFLTFESGARLEIMNRPNVDTKSLPLNHMGLIHAAFSVGSREAVDEMAQRLHMAGYEVLSGPRVTGDGYYEACIKGPEDLQIEITV